MFNENEIKTLYKDCFKSEALELIPNCAFRNSDFKYYVDSYFESIYEDEITREMREILDDYYDQLLQTFRDFIARY